MKGPHSRVRINDPLYSESTDNRWIHFKKDQLCEKFPCYDVIIQGKFRRLAPGSQCGRHTSQERVQSCWREDAGRRGNETDHGSHWYGETPYGAQEETNQVHLQA